MAGRKCNVNCAVYGCTSVRKKNPELSFHSFPKKGEKVNIKNGFGVEEVCNRRQLWEAKLKIGKKVSKSMKICSVHFKKEDFEHASKLNIQCGNYLWNKFISFEITEFIS
jgi:hypothetical protein